MIKKNHTYKKISYDNSNYPTYDNSDYINYSYAYVYI